MVSLLAIDTTEDACSAALLTGETVEERFEIAPRRHSELILPMMDELLAAAGLHLADLDAMAFGRGPGAFTGLRIAASVAQGAAFGAGLPVVPVSSLQALAQGARRVHGADRVLTAFDARMGEVYWGAFAADDDGVMRAVLAESVCSPGNVAVPGPGDWHAAGSGWGAYPDALSARCGVPVAVDAGALVHAQDVAILAARLFREGAAVAAEEALPVYLRNQVAWARPGS
jgi:tRNA threonylcarbamoyladenosine biosynthesis protein TsaB